MAAWDYCLHPSLGLVNISTHMWAQYNVVMLNTSGATSGKSILITRFVTGIFKIIYDPTIEDAYEKVAVIDGEECVLKILDTSSTEEFHSMRELYMLNGDGFLLVFSVNSRASFDGLEFHQKFLKTAEGKPAICELHNSH